MVCAVARWPCRMMAWTRSSPMIRGSMVSSTADTAIATSDAIAANSSRLVRNSEIATIGNSSPTAPAAST